MLRAPDFTSVFASLARRVSVNQGRAFGRIVIPAGLGMWLNYGGKAAQATWSQYGVMPTMIGRHLAYEARPTVTRG